MQAIHARGIVKAFDGAAALGGVDLALAPGEVRGLLGPNGAGKTTLLRILLGLVRPDAGTVAIGGEPPSPRHAGVAGWAGTPAFYPYLSGRANLRLLSRLDGNPAAPLEELLGQVGLETRADDRVATYSTGMRQRLGLAAALLRRPRVLLLDEPAAGLDPAGTRDLQRLLARLAADGVAVALSSHHVDEVEALCGAFTILRAGHVVFDGSAGELRARAPAPVFRLGTADDALALALARAVPGAVVEVVGGALELRATPAVRDAVVLALGAAGVAVQRLELARAPLAALFFALTEADA